jgi:hypothetical protein
MKQSGVTTKHPQYAKYAPLWQRCRDASEGQQSVYERTTAYLPKLTEEKDTEYMARMKRTPFFNAVWRTISGLKGMVFRKPAVFTAPASMQTYAENIDMAGTPLDMFAQQITQSVLTTGRAGILVDYPQVAEAGQMTVAQAEAMGLRPMLARYEAESIINWKTSRINGAQVLTLIVLEEKNGTPADDFDHSAEDVWRVLDLTPDGYRQRVYRKNDKGDELISESYPMMRGQVLREIPFYFISADNLSVDVDVPPLMDLVDMNFKHYTVSADYEHACHFSGLPTLFLTGHQPDAENPIYIGGTAANCLPDPNAKAFFVETAGSFPALRENLEDKKAQMAVLGARMLETQRASVESADTQKTRQAGEQSQLASMAVVIGMGITRALRMFSQWAGIAGEVQYTLNKDFLPVGMTAQELTALVASWQAGAISEQTLFENLKAGELIADSVTFEDEQERIRSQRPAE